jgi:hypothetical protein
VISEKKISQNLATLAKHFTELYSLLYEAHWILNFCHQVAKKSPKRNP